MWPSLAWAPGGKAAASQAGDRTLHADHIIIATGSEAVVPELEGAGNVTVWTNRETFTATTQPDAHRSKELGFESAGVKLDAKGGVEIDQHCRAANGVWAIGDVTGIMPFTHVAKYQGRIVANAILGHPRPAIYDGIPRVVFGDREIAAAGITQARADKQGLSTAFAELDLAQSIARPSTYEHDPRGDLGLLTDTDKGVLIGA